MQFQFQPIGFIQSCYKEKFGIPRQPGLVTEARASLTLIPPFNQANTIHGLAQFSHIWLVFVFHATQHQGWQPTVRPPRLGGNKRLGVFATRSMYRPNPLGLSVVALTSINIQNGTIRLELQGCDLLDGTPILDIKPYIPYADALPHAQAGFANNAPAVLQAVSFTELALQQCQHKQAQWGVDIQRLITQILQQDPRPSYRQSEATPRVYAMRLYDFDLKWEYKLTGIKVLELYTPSSLSN
jgi:tRNA-Thr(GGU) m(6)t(6)A37 methyltransferase TsaA